MHAPDAISAVVALARHSKPRAVVREGHRQRPGPVTRKLVGQRGSPRPNDDNDTPAGDGQGRLQGLRNVRLLARPPLATPLCRLPCRGRFVLAIAHCQLHLLVRLLTNLRYRFCSVAKCRERCFRVASDVAEENEERANLLLQHVQRSSSYWSPLVRPRRRAHADSQSGWVRFSLSLLCQIKFPSDVSFRGESVDRCMSP